MSALRNRWLSIRRGWRIAIATILGLALLLGGTWLFLYQRTALAREFDAMLMGITRMANAQGPLALTDDQIRQILVPLRNLEIQTAIEPDAARKALSDVRAALTPEQTAALATVGGALGGQFVNRGWAPNGGSSANGGNAVTGGSGTPQTGGNPGSWTAGGFGDRNRRLTGLRVTGRLGPLARLLAPLRLKLPAPTMVSQVCQRLEDRLNGVAPNPPAGQAPQTAPPDATAPQ